MSQHVVGEGDDILSLAFDAGVSVSKVFDDPANAALRDASGHPLHDDSEAGGRGRGSRAGGRHRYGRCGEAPHVQAGGCAGGAEPGPAEGWRAGPERELPDQHRRGPARGHDRRGRQAARRESFPNDKIARLRIGEDVGEFIFHLGSLDPVNTVQGLQEAAVQHRV